MASFPKLKTNAAAQYPASRSVRYQNEALRFLDGAEQTYRDSAGPLHRWEIQLSQLDEGEMAAIEAFFAENQGAFGSFAFVDPWDGQTYPTCSLETDGLETTELAEMNGATSLTVVENRG